MVGKPSIGSRLFDVLNSVLMVLMITVTLYPILYVLFASVSNPSQFIARTTLLYRPLGFTLEAYKLVLQNQMIGIGYRNTIIYLVLGTFINMVMTSLGAFVLSRKGYMLKKLLTWIALLTMYLSGGLIPYYILVKNLGMIDTIWAMIIPGAISTYNMIVLRTAFMNVPQEIEESAKLDGANEWTILIFIFMPLVVSTLAVIALFYAVGHWNSWFGAMIFLKTRSKFPLQLVLREILILNSTDYRERVADEETAQSINEIVKYATIMVSTVPILFIYPFLQRYFVKGVMIGAIKG